MDLLFSNGSDSLLIRTNLLFFSDEGWADSFIELKHGSLRYHFTQGFQKQEFAMFPERLQTLLNTGKPFSFSSLEGLCFSIRQTDHTGHFELYMEKENPPLSLKTSFSLACADIETLILQCQRQTY